MLSETSEKSPSAWSRFWDPQALLGLAVVSSLITKSCPALSIPRAIVHQAPLYTDFSGKTTGVKLPFLSPGDLPNLGIELASPALQVDSLPLSHREWGA